MDAKHSRVGAQRESAWLDVDIWGCKSSTALPAYIPVHGVPACCRAQGQTHIFGVFHKRERWREANCLPLSIA